MACTKIKPIRFTLNVSIDYICNEEKSYKITGINCNADTAYTDMMLTKYRWGKADRKVKGHHVIQAFAPGEVTPELAHEIGVRYAQECFGADFEVVVSTHIDKEHIHTHLIFISVSFVDGHMYQGRFRDYYDTVRGVSDRLCWEYGLSIIEFPKVRRKSYDTVQAEAQGKPTWESLIKDDIDNAIEWSVSFQQFLHEMGEKGYALKTHTKYLAVRPEGKERYVRTKTLGAGYTEQDIRDRIEQQLNLMPALHVRFVRGPRRDEMRPSLKIKGIRALYFRYLYQLGILPQNGKPRSRKAQYVREDFYQLQRYAQQMAYIRRNRFESVGEVEDRAKALKQRIGTLNTQREALHRRKQRAPEDERPQLDEQTEALTAEIRALRREVKTCRGIVENTRRFRERMNHQQEKEAAKEPQKARIIVWKG